MIFALGFLTGVLCVVITLVVAFAIAVLTESRDEHWSAASPRRFEK